ncbi:binder of sperm protein homolog 2-like [Suricata suricatta]|uniref:Fibronectin type-II domain-containing protein n=1 Tax=Suricata suricatta TaxID=37032 RepID=A0A673UT70_SURSU|nr:binder of sperm protein homolog 2-like [Suricata suricatta]
MNSPASWLSLAVCVSALKAEFSSRVPNPALQGFVNGTCVFPFVYGDVTYYTCTSVHSNYDWCSLDKKFRGRWRYCTGQDPPQCTFPFLYRRKLFHKCTKKGYVLNWSWCSLTKNYDKDGKWKKCSPHNL